MTRRPIQTVALATLMIMSTFVGVVALPMATGTADASHEPKANYTFAPQDHTPGLDNGAAEHYAVGLEKDLTALHTIVVSSQEFDFADCSADKTTAFGIDRGNDDPGTQTDESLLTKYSSISFQPNKIVVKFNKEDGLGSSTVGLKTNDQIVAAGQNCYDNPDQKGWYQVQGMLNGSTNDDSKTDYEINVKTHYIYICDCSSEQEAREKLGPPPSEQGESTATATEGGSGESTATATEGGSGESTPTPTEGGSSEPTATSAGTATGAAGTSTGTSGTASGNATATGNGTATDNATATGGSGASTATGGGNPATGSTPSEGSGPGFGLAAALGAILASGALVLRRRD